MMLKDATSRVVMRKSEAVVRLLQFQRYWPGWDSGGRGRLCSPSHAAATPPVTPHSSALQTLNHRWLALNLRLSQLDEF